MNLISIQTALRGLEKSAGAKADARVSIKFDEITCYFRPIGWGIDTPSILANGDTPEAAVAEAARQWAEMSNSVRVETVKKMSLAIIRLTHEHGGCTDAALRAEFDLADVKRYGSEAVTLANNMADNGPFSIEFSAKANAA